MTEIPTPLADLLRSLPSVTERHQIVTIVEAFERNAYVTSQVTSQNVTKSKAAERTRRWRAKKVTLVTSQAEADPFTSKLSKKVRRRRSPSVTLRDDFAPDPKIAFSAGLSEVEAGRELLRFKNHARQNERTCRNWDAAWANWCIKAAEFLGKSPPNHDQPKLVEMSGFYASFDSPQLMAWELHARNGGTKYPRDKRGGWRFPTEWPPGYEKTA